MKLPTNKAVHNYPLLLAKPNVDLDKFVFRLLQNFVQQTRKTMNIVSIRIITVDIKKSVAFYEQISNLPVIQYTPDFAELKTPAATLAIGSTNTLQFFGGEDVAKAAQNRSAIIEFRVKDVDESYNKLADFIEPCLVQKPTTMPWGNRSLLFRDPDGNLVNFFTPVTPDAIKKFDGA